MRNSRIVKKIISLLPIASVVLILSLIGIKSSFNSPVYGHDFIPNESAFFLSFAKQLQTESELVQTNLASSKVALAREHGSTCYRTFKFKRILLTTSLGKRKLLKKINWWLTSLLQQYLV